MEISNICTLHLPSLSCHVSLHRGLGHPGMPLTDGNSSVPWKPHASPSLRLPKDHKLWVHIPQADCTSSAIRRVETLIVETLNSEHDELKREGERGEAADRYVPFNPNQNGTIHSWDPINICNKICHNRLIKKNKMGEELIKGSLEVKQAAIQSHYNWLLAAPFPCTSHSKSWDCKLTEWGCFSSPSPQFHPLLFWLMCRKGLMCLLLSICRFTVTSQHPTAAFGRERYCSTLRGRRINP